MKKILFNASIGDASPTHTFEWVFRDGGENGTPYITKYNVYGQGVTANLPLLTTIVGQINEVTEVVPMVEIAEITTAVASNGLHVVCSNQVPFEGAVRITPGMTYVFLGVHSAADPAAVTLSFTTWFQWEVSWL